MKMRELKESKKVALVAVVSLVLGFLALRSLSASSTTTAEGLPVPDRKAPLILCEDVENILLIQDWGKIDGDMVSVNGARVELNSVQTLWVLGGDLIVEGVDEGKTPPITLAISALHTRSAYVLTLKKGEVFRVPVELRRCKR